MADRPIPVVRIAEDLGSLPLPPEELWVRQVQPSRWLPSIAVAAAVVVLAIAVALPLSAQLPLSGGGTGSGASPSTTEASDAPASRAAAVIPACGAAQSPVLDISFPPPPGDAAGSGSATAEIAFRRAFPTVADFTVTHPFSDGPGGPSGSSRAIRCLRNTRCSSRPRAAARATPWSRSWPAPVELVLGRSLPPSREIRLGFSRPLSPPVRCSMSSSSRRQLQSVRDEFRPAGAMVSLSGFKTRCQPRVR